MVPPSGSPVRAPLAVAAIAVAAVAVRAAPCPYDASADLNSLLDRSQMLWSESEERGAGYSYPIPTYARCDPFYEGDIFLDGMEPWADPERGPGPMEPEVQLWPGGVVYYTTSVYDSNVLLILNISIADIESRTATAAGPCIRFEPWSPGVSEDFLFITDQLTNSCCFSSIGRRGGNQSLNIGIKGNNVGNAKHLLMHALGFWHEHSRPGRDADIEVLWDNVTEGLECFFDKYRNETEFVQTDPYDLTSVTHISLNTWARERGQDTLRPRSPTNETDIGFKQRLSTQDIRRIRAKYGCPVPDETTTYQPTTAEPVTTTERTTTVLPTTELSTTEQSTTVLPTTERTTTVLPTTERTTTVLPTTEQTTTVLPTTEDTTTVLPTTERTTTVLPTTERTTTVFPTTERPTTVFSTTEQTTTYLPPRVVCKDQPDGLMLAYPDDCHKFYKCSGGRDYVCCCPLPLVFSAEESTCDHEWHVPCDTPDQESECPQHHVPDSAQCRYS
ncbi:zinc metalloproteinase nas-14-like [Amphibalanus amphitrite]|uniref:zinc metalloproteinase nas-14-like n=1 Tax=Amphibalanus amphitrite TaxID=1232801 RepID=UPI001C921224|nr:zinc metalloproteinase nas-14-like [Amphibalanus amphitrite]